MTHFISFASEIKDIIAVIIETELLHAKWLNTLSYLENCGARKIAACEHPTLVKEEVLKHASEEFRHAHYLKKQISRVSPVKMENYVLENLLGAHGSRQYLNRLDLQTSRYLAGKGLDANAIKEAAYLLVTYAIELRADELYPIYDALLRSKRSKVTVKSILLEEIEHLKEMTDGLNSMPNGMEHAKFVCDLEATLCKKWLVDVLKDLGVF